MKTKQFLLKSALLVAVTLLSCKTDKIDSNNNGGTGVKGLVTYTINGGAFHNQAITISSDSSVPQSGAVSLFGYLKISLSDAPTDKPTTFKGLFFLNFNHAGTGTAKVNDPINSTVKNADKLVEFLLQVQVNGQTKILTRSATAPAETPGTITITKFGSVGGAVEGNFEGTLTDGSITYTITGGHFIAARKS